jgi:hypothetical protein
MFRFSLAFLVLSYLVSVSAQAAAVVLAPGQTELVNGTQVTCSGNPPQGEVISKVDLGCLDTLVATAPGNPATKMMMVWLKSCRNFPSQQPGCSVVGGGFNNACYNYVLNALHTVPGTADLAQIQMDCRDFKLKCF